MFSSQKIDKQFILERVREEEIIERYLKTNVEFNRLFLNPLRKDTNPTLSFKKLSNRIWIKDWSGWFEGDCFNLVEKLYHVKFYKACEIIAQDFNLIKKDKTYSPVKIDWIEYKEEERVKTKIEIKRRQYEDYDLKYWNDYGISLKTLTFFKVYALKVLWVNGLVQYYFKHKKDLCYCYYFYNEEFKAYFPNRTSYRFRTNTNCLQGELQLPYEGELLVITKSYKEVMLFHEYGIYAIAPQSESVIITQEKYNELEKRFTYIVSNYDFDLAGIRSSNKMKRLYSIEPFFLTTGKFNTINYGAKDISDYRKLKGKEKTDELISRFISRFL